MESPCILVCSIDMATGYCFGCGRTRDEIGGWTLYSSDERRGLRSTVSSRDGSAAMMARRSSDV